jgi:ribosomal protein S18 acetylase RimI-like enzyme
MAALPPQHARTEELAPAFRLIFRHLSPADRDARLANALRLIQSGDLDPAGVFVLREAGELVGALVCAPLPGAGAALWPPTVVEGPRQGGREDDLLRSAVDWLRGRGSRLVQALLAPEDEPQAGPLERNGLARVTTLWYLRHDLSLPGPRQAGPFRATFEPYDPGDPQEFHLTLARTYEGTLDCPEVTGARTIEEVIQGHRAQGAFDPDRWWLARLDGSPVGVLMTVEVPETASWEVAYMGVVPEARRRGLGRELLLHALAAARASRAPSVHLSVDVRNQPAWQLYRSLGFEPVERRAVHLAVFR